MQEFEFSYMTNKTKASLDDTTLYVKMGSIMKKEIALVTIHFFYIKEYNEYNELIIKYEKSNGKLINLKMIHTKGAVGAIQLLNALSQLFPEKDLRGKDPDEAMKIMKATNSQKLGFWMALLVMITVVSIFFVPYLIHYFDNGHAYITVEDIIEGKKIGTRNVTIEGIVLNAGLWEQSSSGSSSSTENNYFPIVEDSWDEGPIYVVLKTGYMTQDEVDAFVYDLSSFNGIIRDIWWEGLDEEQIDFFISEYNFKMADDLIMIEIGENTDRVALFSYLGILLIIIIIFIVMWIRQKRRAAF